MKRLLPIILAVFMSSAFGAPGTPLTTTDTQTKSAGLLSFAPATVCFKGATSGCISISTSAIAGSGTLNIGTGGTLGSLAFQSGTFPQTSVTGNAGTATALQTARTINGVSFDGTAAITVPAAAGTLTGTTLASNVVTSSLTGAAGGSFGTAAFTAISAYDAAGAAAAVLPSQTGNSGKFLTTNGSAPSWGTVVGGVSSFNTRTGAVTQTSGDVTGALGYTPVDPSTLASIATSGSATDLSTGTVPAARLPNPTATTLGGVESIAAVSHQFLTSISTSGVPAQAQPAFTDVSGSVAAGQMPALTGDITTSAGAVATTLATVNGNVGTFGSATKASSVTVNAKGLVTAASEATVTPALGSITGLGTGVGTALATNVGSAGAPVVLNGAGGTPSSMTATNLSGIAAALTAGTVTTNANLSGDVTSAGNATTLATVNSNVGSFTNASVTVNGKGLVTAASSGAAPALPLVPTAVKTSAYNAAANDFVPVDTTSGSVTVTLPTAPADGAQIAVKQIIRGGTNTVTIAAGGSDVFNKSGGGASLTLTLVNAGYTVQYKASGAIWYATADDLPYGSLLANVQTWSGQQTFVAPVLGTPASGIATNLTGTAASLTAGNVTTNANLTGPITSSGNATSIASQTGTGTKFVVDTAPTLVTPVLGVATATSINGFPIANAAADGTTFGIPAFTAADFNAASGVISLDYINGQKASGSQPGFLSATDWTTFNGKGAGTVTSIATTAPITGGTITGSGTIALNVGVDHAFTAAQSVTKTINATSADGLLLTNTTAATVGAQQWSPRLHFTGQGWKTTSTAGSQTVDWIAELQPVQGAANPSANLVFSSQVNGAGYTQRFALASGLGTASAPALRFGSTANTVGFYSRTGGEFNVTAGGGADVMEIISGQGAYFQTSVPSIGWSGSSTSGVAFDTALTRVSAAVIQQGVANAASPVAQTLQAQGSRAGTDTNVSGANYTHSSGQGTGNAAASSLIFQTPVAVASGSGAQTMQTVMTLNNNSVNLFGASPTATYDVFGQKTSNGPVSYVLYNASNGASAYSAMLLLNTANTSNAGMSLTSSGFTTSGVLGANTFQVYNGGGGALNIANLTAGQPINFTLGGWASPTLKIDGTTGVTIGSGVKLTFNGSSSGTTVLAPAAAAGTTTLTMPAVTDTLAVLGAQTFTGTQTFGGLAVTHGYTVGTLPTGITGARAHVTDQLTTCAAIGAAILGGGVVTCPVFYNGASWVGGDAGEAANDPNFEARRFA